MSSITYVITDQAPADLGAPGAPVTLPETTADIYLRRGYIRYPSGPVPVPQDPQRFATVDFVRQELRKSNERVGAAETVGDGAATSFAVSHGLGARDVIVQVYDLTDGEEVLADVARTDDDTVTISFGTAPAVDQYRVVVLDVRPAAQPI